MFGRLAVIAAIAAGAVACGGASTPPATSITTDVPSEAAQASAPAPSVAASTPASASASVPTTPGGAAVAVPSAWVPRAEGPRALTEVAAAAFGGSVWVVGGFDREGGPVADVSVYDPTFDAWSPGPPLPQARHHTALVGAGDTLYVLGGYVTAGFDAPTSSVLRLDAASGEWAEATPLPRPLAAGAGVFDGARVLYAGGAGADGVSDDVVALKGGAWKPVGRLGRAREHLGAASDGVGRAWVLGGREGGLDRNVADVDLVEGGEVTPTTPLPTARGGAAAFFLPGVGACLVGGEAPTGTFADVECVTPDGATHVLPSLAAARHGLGAVAVEGAAYALLGGPAPGLTVSAAVEALVVG